MKLKVLILFTAVLAIGLATAFSPAAENTESAADLIEQAQKHDNMYTLGPEASQQKALSFYESALAAKPDDKQRLHILYRMAQLYGSAYQLEKGEKPDFRRAIEFNRQIVDSYPLEEPLVFKAITSISSLHSTLWEFETALEWSKKILQYDTSQIAEQIKAAENKKQRKSLKRLLAKIERYQETAVDQIAYSARHIGPLRAHGELRYITDTYADTFIAERAAEHLIKNMDKMSELWAPQEDPFSPSESSLQAAASAPAAHSESQKKDIQIQTNITPKLTEGHRTAQPSTTLISQKDKHVAREPRAPPRSYLSECIFGAAGLTFLVLAAIVIKKRKTSF